MKTVHRWIRSGSYLLAARLDMPERIRGRGAIIVSPFGWEDVCCYRSLRYLGQTLAANGIPTLRFDLPGTADSSGSPGDSGLVAAWIQSVGDAAAELRKSSGIEDVAVVGIRLGALLALAAVARGANLQDMVLWGPATGRSILRELLAFHKLERQEYAIGDSLPSNPVPGLDVAGFLVSQETQEDLKSLDLSGLPNMQDRHIMILSRDDIGADPGVIRALEASGGNVEVKVGSGYATMMIQPHDSVPPLETSAAIVEFLSRDQKEELSPTVSDDTPTAAITENSRICGTETVCTIGDSSASIFGILTEAAENIASDFCILFLNAGASRHIGPNRMWVEAARRWAARGVRSFRMDFQGIGESGGELDASLFSLYQGHSVEQVEVAIDYLRSRVAARRFAVIGLCSGAFWAFHAAIRNPAVRGSILLNPRLYFWDPEVDRRREVRRAVNGLTDSTAWRRLAHGRVSPQRIKQAARIMLNRFRDNRVRRYGIHQIPPQEIARAWKAIDQNGSRLTLVFTEGEPLLFEMEDEGQFPPENDRFRCIRMANCGHTFRPLWAQEAIHEIIDDELDMVIRSSIAEFGELPQTSASERQVQVMR